MWVWNKKTKAENHLKNYLSLEGFPKIQGYNFEKEFNFEDFLQSYKNVGFQGSNLGVAISIFKDVIEKRIPLYVSFTGNMISSGNRELITYLVKNKKIKVIVTTASSIEEDIIKCIKPFHLGAFEAKGSFLAENFIGRIGNIFVPADRYVYFEKFINEVFKEIYNKQKTKEKIFSTYEITNEIGKHAKKSELTSEKFEESFLYWAWRNEIPVFCPGITDGALGDISVFFKRNNPDFAIDITGDNKALTSMLMNEDKTASLILGGGISKHFLLNAAIFRDGFEYSIYLTTAAEFDGSDSGGNQEEAISWNKIKTDARRVKVMADATITFPILVSSIVSSIARK
ncbi:deoxyhypusine synthase [Candidatus Woesearchaeota archaeon]|nr:deoxyhypusine synthase [Candidatus Woesearchaeota archaeon]